MPHQRGFANQRGWHGFRSGAVTDGSKKKSGGLRNIPVKPASYQKPVSPPAPNRPAHGGVAVVMPAAPLFSFLFRSLNQTKSRSHRLRLETACMQRDQDAAAFGLLLELRWKNRAWLATADTMAGWNGLEIRNAGSGRSPVRKRSG